MVLIGQPPVPNVLYEDLQFKAGALGRMRPGDYIGVSMFEEIRMMVNAVADG